MASATLKKHYGDVKVMLATIRVFFITLRLFQAELAMPASASPGASKGVRQSRKALLAACHTMHGNLGGLPKKPKL